MTDDVWFPVPSMAVDLAEIPALVAAMFPAGDAIAFDIRGEEGNQSIIERIRFLLDEDKIVALWDSDGIMPAFSIGKGKSAYVICDGGGFRGAFITLEATLKHGLTMWQGRSHG